MQTFLFKKQSEPDEILADGANATIDDLLSTLSDNLGASVSLTSTTKSIPKNSMIIFRSLWDLTSITSILKLTWLGQRSTALWNGGKLTKANFREKLFLKSLIVVALRLSNVTILNATPSELYNQHAIAKALGFKQLIMKQRPKQMPRPSHRSFRSIVRTDEAINLIYAGKFTKKKGSSRLETLVLNLTDKGINCKLYVVGDIDRTFNASECKNIIFLGPIPRQILLEALPFFDYAAQLSEAEGLSNFIIESIQSGLRVFCSPESNPLTFGQQTFQICDSYEQAIDEWFLSGTNPEKTCDPNFFKKLNAG